MMGVMGRRRKEVVILEVVEGTPDHFTGNLLNPRG